MNCFGVYIMEETTDDYGPDAKSVLRQPTRKLLLELLKARSERPLVLSQLSSQTKKHHSSVWYHLHVLEKYELIEHFPADKDESHLRHKFKITEKGLKLLDEYNKE